VYQHELTHKTINEAAGAENCVIGLNWLNAYTTCDWPVEVLKSVQYQNAVVLNGINEIVSYNLQAVILLVLAIAVWFANIKTIELHRQTLTLSKANSFEVSQYLSNLKKR
jgi:hypothetical protein